MALTSFYFLCFFALVLFLYYVLPGKVQWIVLLTASIVYYLTSGNPILIVYPVAASLICYAGIRLICASQDRKKRRRVLLAVILCNVAVLFLLKYINFGINTVNGIAGLFGQEEVFSLSQWLIPLGISYYTLSLIGYVVDVYNEIAPAQKNFAKLALYGMYFPVMTSGPILRYREDGEQFFKPHKFDYVQVTRGLQRMLWGFFQKLVISERMAKIVSTVYGDYASYPGAYIWLATVCFAFQLYTDFNGCMDIVLGISETFGLKLPENFQTPFFSKNISEYWRRWHITLGVWMKEYIFYPLLRSQAFTRLGKKNKERFGKKRGKQFTTFAAMFVLWFTVGIWHGGDWKYVIGSGLLHWFYIVCGELLQPWFDKGMKACHINPKAKWVDVFRILRTFFLVNIGFVFFRADSVKDAVKMLISAVSVFNPQVLFQASLFTLGLDWIEFTIAVVSLLMLLAVSLYRQKGSVREKIASWPIVCRYLFWYALVFYIILLGNYGPDYSAAEFIYQGF